MTRSNRHIFKVPYSRNSKRSEWNPYEILTFLLGKLQQKIFLSYTLPTQGILHTEFGWIWTSPWPDERDLFLKFANREIRKFTQQIYVWTNNFFPRQAIAKILFALHSNYTGDTPYRVWLNLENSLNRWKVTERSVAMPFFNWYQTLVRL